MQQAKQQKTAQFTDRKCPTRVATTNSNGFHDKMRSGRSGRLNGLVGRFSRNVTVEPLPSAPEPYPFILHPHGDSW